MTFDELNFEFWTVTVSISFIYPVGDQEVKTNNF
jgi:hypothetical protein